MESQVERIRDNFLARAKELGYRVEVQPRPPRGYLFCAEVYAGSSRFGRLCTRKTTASWRPSGAPRAIKVDREQDLTALLPPLHELEATPSVPPEPAAVPPVEQEEPEPTPVPPGGAADESVTEETERPVEIEGSAAEPSLPPVEEEPAKEPALPVPTSGAETTPQRPSVAEVRSAPSPPGEKPIGKPPTSLSRAMTSFKEGDFEKAIQWARLALAENPGSPTAKDILARAQRLVESGRTEEAAVPPAPPVVHAPLVTKPETTPLVPTPPSIVHGPEPRQPGAPPWSPPAVTTTPAPPPTKATPPPQATRKRRTSPWVFVAFGIVVIALWVTRPRTMVPHGQPRLVAPVTADTLAELRTYAAQMMGEVEADTVGLPHNELMAAVLEILKRSAADSSALTSIRRLSARADSLGRIRLRANRFSQASELLEQSRRGWEALALAFPGDSAVAALQGENDLCREVLATKKSMFTTMVPVPAGAFPRGSNRGGLDARPEREIQISGFYIDKFEVTNQQYRAFVLDTGSPPPDGTRGRGGWQSASYPEGQADFPVVYVSWEEASRFASWAAKRLPTEAEWEKAARGIDGRAYPWGEEFDQSRVVCRGAAGAAQVGSIPSGASPCGALDMAGNVREWIADYYDPLYYGRAPQVDPPGPARGRERVVRGGSWRHDCDVEGLTHVREAEPPTVRADDLGFRLVMSDSAYHAQGW